MARQDLTEGEALSAFDQTCLADIRARDNPDVAIEDLARNLNRPVRIMRGNGRTVISGIDRDADLQYSVTRLSPTENPRGHNLVRVKCALGFSIDDQSEVMRRLPALLGNDLNLTQISDGFVTQLEEVRTYDGTRVRVTLTPEGDVVIDRLNEDLTGANDFRFTTLSVRWLRAPQESDPK